MRRSSLVGQKLCCCTAVVRLSMVALQPAGAESELLAFSAVAQEWESFAACIIGSFGLEAWLKVAGSDFVSAFGRVVLRNFGAV